MSSVSSPKPSQHIQKRTREWFRKAEHELAFLDYAPFDLDDPPTDTAGKMAHMAGEYTLKAFLMFNKRKISKTHDLVELLDECMAVQNDADFEMIRDDCQVLTRYRVEFVYPGPIPEQISVEEARLAIQKAHSIYNFVHGKVEIAGYSAA
jgi:HEPN domain-containing protein